MDNGRILQLGRPGELYARPASVKVAQFIGTPAINLLAARVGASHGADLFGSELPIRVPRSIGTALTLGIRPESISAAPVGTTRPGHHALAGRLHRSENLGAEHILHVDLAAPGSGSVTCKVAADPDAIVDGARNLALLFPPAACHVFDEDGRRVADAEMPGGVTSGASPAPVSAAYP
jgi:multiple sugar transport system ATP-binding protein